MANRVKEVSAFNGTSWGAAVPLGVNDANVDITSSTSQPNGSAVSGVTGDSATALDTTAVAVASGDTGASAWTKFNRFRKRVANNFANYIQGSIATSYNATGSDSAVYSTNVLNNYMANVIGYSGTAAPSEGAVANQLSSLNDRLERSTLNITTDDGTSELYSNIFWSITSHITVTSGRLNVVYNHEVCQFYISITLQTPTTTSLEIAIINKSFRPALVYLGASTEPDYDIWLLRQSTNPYSVMGSAWVVQSGALTIYPYQNNSIQRFYLVGTYIPYGIAD